MLKIQNGSYYNLGVYSFRQVIVSLTVPTSLTTIQEFHFQLAQCNEHSRLDRDQYAASRSDYYDFK
jgi:hypothetical protein